MNLHQGATGMVRNPVEDLAGKLQLLPADIRWLHAVPNVIQSIACGTPLILGPRTRFVAEILDLARVPALARLMAALGCLCLLAAAYVRQFRVASGRHLGSLVFVGIGALREKDLVHNLEQDRGQQAFFLDERSLASFSSVHRVSLIDLWREWRSVLHAVWDALGHERSDGLPAANLRVEFCTQGHRYVFLRAWFRRLKASSRVDQPIAFSAASSVSYACIASGLDGAYHLHGFQRQSLVYADFVEAVCFTEVEAEHLSRRLPGAHVRVREEQGKLIETNAAVAIAGCYGQTEGFQDCIDFVNWARGRGLTVIVRPHPLDETDFFAQWRADPHIHFVDTSSPFDVFLERYRPRMVLSWFSTALFDALRRGVVPVIVRTESWRPLDTVFPFKEISLHWPLDRELAERLMDSDRERVEFLSEKRTVASIGSLS